MQNTTFVPSQRTVSVGTTITWTNKDNADHDVASTTGVFSSPTMGKNATFSYTFNTAGTFNYVCNFHPGMTGKIIVQ
jgi:plastocyanin